MAKTHYRIEDLEERKIQEIEHSRNRRTILKGSERTADTNAAEQVDLGQVVRDQDAFKKHFSNVKYYSIQKRLEDYERDWFRQRCRPGIKVLDFACGNGENGIMAAKFGATVIGIDLSPEGLENAEDNARTAGVESLCTYEAMDGENMAFADDTFDYIVVYGALHHVDLDRAMGECRRVLKPGGEMLALEALRHNPLIHLYRKMTPHLRTPWEVDHILGVPEIRRCARYFESTHTKYFHLLSLLAVPFRKTPLFRPLRSFLDRIDEVILRWEPIGKYSWVSATTFSRPRKS